MVLWAISGGLAHQNSSQISIGLIAESRIQPQINRQDSWKIGKDGAGKQQGKFKPMESTPV